MVYFLILSEFGRDSSDAPRRSDANNAERILATIGIGPKAKKKNKPKQLPPMEHDTARALGPPPEGELSHVRKNEVTE